MAAPFKWFLVTMLIERDARLNELAQGPVTMLSRTTASRAPTSRIPPNRKSVDGAVATTVLPSIRTLSRSSTPNCTWTPVTDPGEVNVLFETTALDVPARKMQAPGLQVTVLCVNRTPGTGRPGPKKSPAKYASPLTETALASSTRPSTTTPEPPRSTTISASREGLSAKRPAPDAAQVSVTFGIVTKTSAPIPIMPRIAITAPGLAAARAARRPASSLTVNVGLEGHATDAVVLNDGRWAVGATLRSWQAATRAMSRATRGM